MEANLAGQSLAAQQVPFSETRAPASWADDLTPLSEADWNYSRAAHLLERAGFGGTPAEVERLAEMTPEQAVRYLLDYEAIDVSRLPGFEPSGIRYSTSMSAGNVHFSFFISCKTSLSGVFPIPQGTFPPSAVLSFMCRLTMRSWYFSRTGSGDSPLVPAK